MSTTLHDVKNQAQLGASFFPITLEAAETGISVDLLNADGPCFAIQAIGTVGGTTPSLTGKIQESSDGSTWTDISGAVFTAVTASENVQVLNFQRTKRYARHVATISGTTPSFITSVLIGEQKKSV